MDVNGVLVDAQFESIPLEALQAEPLRDCLERGQPGEYRAYQIHKRAGLFIRARNEALYRPANGHLSLALGVDTPALTKTDFYLSAEEIHRYDLG